VHDPETPSHRWDSLDPVGSIFQKKPPLLSF
jgi:hypothetical protein